ncbi:MAG: DUF1854 domain-containing protein [Candidatus Dactylopiibacterium sp.]|nr:DUF1854 domain-containing protein [Candidatus Dactylopiibacterium sp.]
MKPAFELQRDAFGRLTLTDADGMRHEGVLPVRAHPISAPADGLAIMGPDGHELVWLDRLEDLPPAPRALLAEELAAREFMPEITRLDSVSSFATPSTWDVQTTRGATRFILKGEENILRLPGNVLLISDAHGIQFVIRDLAALDRHSRRLLDRFL